MNNSILAIIIGYAQNLEYQSNLSYNFEIWNENHTFTFPLDAVRKLYALSEMLSPFTIWTTGLIHHWVLTENRFIYNLLETEF